MGVLRASATTRAAPGDAAIEEFVASVRELAQARASERLMHEFAYHEMIPALLRANRSRRLQTPTLMLNGERDFFIPARAMGGGVGQAETGTQQGNLHAGHPLFRQPGAAAPAR